MLFLLLILLATVNIGTCHPTLDTHMRLNNTDSVEESNVMNERASVIKIRNLTELEKVHQNYRNTVFHLTDSNTFIGKDPQSEMWNEMDLTRITHFVSPDYIPVTSCLAAKTGSASLSFGYNSGISLSGNTQLGANTGLSYLVLSAGLSVSASFGLSKAYNNGGSISCGVKTGEVGQIWVKPRMVSVRPRSRKVVLKSGRFLPEKFKQFTEVVQMGEDGFEEIVCVSDRYVSLKC